MPIRRISEDLIEDICGSFRSLSVLNLSHNEIMQIENLHRLGPCLRKLDLSFNSIESVAVGLEALVQLTHLDLSGNLIVSLDGLEHLVSLETVHAADNRIRTADALRSLSYLPKLHTATLRGNPITHASGYREGIVRRLPALRLLDGDALPMSAAAAGESALARVVAAAPQLPPPPPQQQQAEAAVAKAEAVAATALFEAAAAAAAADESRSAASSAEWRGEWRGAASEHRQAPLGLSVEEERHLRELTAAEHRLATERERSAAALEHERAACEAALDGLRRELHAKDQTVTSLTQAAEGMRAQLAAQQRSAAEQLAEAQKATEAERAHVRQLRTYVHACATAGRARAPAEGAAETATQTEEPAALAASAASAASAGAADDLEWLRSALRACETEKELVQLRLDAMGRLLELQEEALCVGSDPSAGHHALGYPTHASEEEADAAAEEEADGASGGGEHGGGGDDGFGGDESALPPSIGEGARAMVRGWRLKAYDLLMLGETERRKAREEAEQNLAALEASAQEIERLRQGGRLLEAKLAVLEANRTAQRVSSAATDEEHASVKRQLEVARQEAAAEREAAQALAASFRSFEQVHAQLEAKLARAGDELRPLEERLAFATDRAQYLTRLQQAKGGRERGAARGAAVAEAATMTDGAEAATGTAEVAARAAAEYAECVEYTTGAGTGTGTGGEPPAETKQGERQPAEAKAAAHLRAECARLTRERDSVLEQLASRDAAGVATRSALEAEWEGRVHEARAAAGKWQAELQAETDRARALELRCGELERCCEGLRELASKAEAAKAAHAALLGELQSQAVEQRRQGEVARTAEREEAHASLAAAIAKAEEEKAAAERAAEQAERSTLTASEAAAKAAEAAAAANARAADAEDRLKSAEAEAAAAADAAERRLEAAAAEREKLLERDLAGVKRELAKEGVARRSLEREVARLRAQAEQADGSQFEYLEKKVAGKEAQLATLRQERNALLAALRQHQRGELLPSPQPRSREAKEAAPQLGAAVAATPSRPRTDRVAGAAGAADEVGVGAARGKVGRRTGGGRSSLEAAMEAAAGAESEGSGTADSGEEDEGEGEGEGGSWAAVGSVGNTYTASSLGASAEASPACAHVAGRCLRGSPFPQTPEGARGGLESAPREAYYGHYPSSVVAQRDEDALKAGVSSAVYARSGGGAGPHAKRRAQLSAGLLDELQELGQQLLAPVAAPSGGP